MTGWRVTAFALCSLLLPAVLGAEQQGAPSAELLEFIADWGEIDDEDFELLMEHGVRDAATDVESNDDDD